MSSVVRSERVRVLVPLDGSEFARQVIPYAIRVLRPETHVLTLLKVAPVPVGYSSVAPRPLTLEGWSDGVVRPIMEVYPGAWLFFIPFIVATSFTVLNLFIGVIVAAMEAEHEATATAERAALQDDQETILEEIRALRAELRAMQETAGSSAPEPPRP